MPMVSVKSVEDVLKYYSEEVIPALAAALTIDDSFPKEVLNELRNSYTHLARANKLGAHHGDYLKELDGAFRHLKRTCIDCMKVCVYTTARRSEGVVEVLTEELQLPNDIYTTMSELRKKRRDLSAYEGQHPTHDAVKKYTELFNEYDAFYQSLDRQFAGDTAEVRRKARRARERCNLMKAFIVGVISSAVVALVINFGTGAWPFNSNSRTPAAEAIKAGHPMVSDR